MRATVFIAGIITGGILLAFSIVALGIWIFWTIFTAAGMSTVDAFLLAYATYCLVFAGLFSLAYRGLT